MSNNILVGLETTCGMLTEINTGTMELRHDSLGLY